MCKTTTTIKFCTCDVIADANAVSWRLVRYVGRKGNHIMGTVMRTKSDLGNGITVDSVLISLNSEKNAFDFEYFPNENDCLTLRAAKDVYTSCYFRLKFKNGKWVEGCNHPFNSILELIGVGKIQVEKNLIKEEIESPKKVSSLFNWLRRKRITK